MIFNSLTLMPLLASVAAGSSLRGMNPSPLPFEQAVGGERRLDECYAGELDSDGDVCCTAPAIDHSYLTTYGGSEWSGYVQHNSGGEATSNDNAYFAITWNDGPLQGTTINAWCIDLGRFMGNGNSKFDVFSTYDDWNYNDATDSPERLPMVNWLFNNYKIGGTYDIPGCQDNHLIKWKWYQNAIWRLIDIGYHCNADGTNCQRYSHTGLSATETCVENYLVAEAEKNPNFEPGCDDTEVGVLLVVDSESDGSIQKQVLIGEVELAAHGSNLCTDQVCCEKMIPDHELFKHNVELEATFAVSGENGAGWAVTFGAGSELYSGSFDAWSVDLDRNLADGEAHFVDTYSVYDNWYLTNAVDKKENLPKANYLINEYPVGTSTECGSDVTDVQFQDAIWELLDAAATTSTDCVVMELVSAANAAPADYESPCDGNIAVLLVVDQDGTQKQKFDSRAGRDGGTDENGDAIHIQEVTTELLIAVVPLNEGLCMIQECPCCDVTPSPVTPSPVTPSPVTPSPVTPSPVTPSPVTPAPNFVGYAPPTEDDTLAPTGAPIDPTPAPAGVIVVTPSPVAEITTPAPVGGGGYGDPHLKTWTGKVYDFHGECDLLLTKSLAFGHGIGFEAQIRTKIVDDWSYISGVAVKVGDDVLEVSSGGSYVFNGVENADLKAATLAGWKIQKHGGKKDNGVVKMRFRVNFEEHGMMDIKVFNEFLSILVHDVQDHEFFDSVGLMGTFQDGLMVGRDRSTVFSKAIEFGMEWQVRDFDNTLFKEDRFPQWPVQCVMPEAASATHRRLGQDANGAGAGMIPRAMAEKACAHLSVEDRDACVYDVMSTGDVEMASLDSFDE